MNKVMKWTTFIAAACGIIGFIFNLFTGWPVNSLLSIWEHQIIGVRSSENFEIKTIYRKSGRVLNPPDKFSFKLQIPLDARGSTTFKNSDNVWVVLKDQGGGYFLQYPQAEIRNGEWRSHGIRPLEGITKILWIEVDNQGNQAFSSKVENAEWGKFIELPDNSLEVAHVEMR